MLEREGLVSFSFISELENFADLIRVNLEIARSAIDASRAEIEQRVKIPRRSEIPPLTKFIDCAVY